ncbi:Outer membrane protein assembly factor BamB, contains PQQ-like beta-propeller repeat [Streptosporangium subroseum]|uniref:Outer membrane protein assembly factor BamB, contains PQQ-like beta-propeller repeat n=2 Tax=Streptosporangium subroseum TaxID=106412 RepID=A0A239F1A2_9ACTN|nr:Outer membrane protein assembly factor BamB, contains PQQ-like beta-propeller repeat [Streptosporangium subroseum]
MGRGSGWGQIVLGRARGKAVRFTLCSLLISSCVIVLPPREAPPAHRRDTVPIATHPVMVPLWREDLKAELSDSYRVRDTLLLAHGRTLEARDTYTGKKLWTWGKDFLGENESFITWSSDDGVVSTSTSAPYDADESYSDERTTVYTFDARTGIQLWSLTSPYVTDDGYFNLIGASAGQAFLLYPRRGDVMSVDVHTGVRRWRKRLWSGCDLGGTPAVSNRMVAVLVTCGTRPTTLWALDPMNGRVMWTHALPTGKPEDVALRDSVVEVIGATSITLLDMGGTALYRNNWVERGKVAVGAGVIGMSTSTQTLATVPTVTLADIASGQDRGSYPNDGLLFGGRRLYFDSSLTGGPRASILYRVDETDRVPQPIGPVFQEDELKNAWDDVFLFDVSLEGPDTTLAAYEVRDRPDVTPAQAVRGLVPTEAWPDACELLPESMGGITYRRVPAEVSPLLGLDRPVRCYLEPHDNDGPHVGLDVMWVFPDSSQAHRYLSEIAMDDGDSPIAEADEGYRSGPLSDTVKFRVGAAIFRLYTDKKPDLTLRIMRRIVKQLKEQQR